MGTFWGKVREGLSDAAIFIGADALLKQFTKNGAQAVADHVKGKITNDRRAELLEDLRWMGEKDKKNLIRRHKEAIANFTENRFVDLLCKIPESTLSPDECGRQGMLKYLNDLSDEEFDQMLYLLEHDVLLQWFERIRRTGGRFIKKDFDELRSFLSKTTTRIGNGAADALRVIADWTDELPGTGREISGSLPANYDLKDSIFSDQRDQMRKNRRKR